MMGIYYIILPKQCHPNKYLRYCLICLMMCAKSMVIKAPVFYVDGVNGS